MIVTCLVVLSHACDMVPGRMSERVVKKYLRYATDDMIQNNRREIRCLCRKCKKVGLMYPFSREFLEHLLIHGFMDGHTQWLDEDDDDEVMMVRRMIMINMTIITITGKKTKS